MDGKMGKWRDTEIEGGEEIGVDGVGGVGGREAGRKTKEGRRKVAWGREGREMGDLESWRGWWSGREGERTLPLLQS